MKWIALKENVEIPTIATAGSAGADIRANEKAIINPGEWKLIKTGLAVQMDAGTELQIRPRSGLALKYGVTVLNAPGTVDSDYYPNEVGVVLINHGKEPFIVYPGDRIAQGMFCNYLITAADISNTTERKSGFGSTGHE